MANPWHGKSVIIVDDSESSRSLLESLYKDAGLNIIESVSSGLELLNIVRESVPDYISLDIIMPEMDGIECYFKLKDLEIPTQVFFVSALSVENRVVSVYADEIPSSVFLPKPLTIEIFEGFLRSAGDIAISKDGNEKP